MPGVPYPEYLALGGGIVGAIIALVVMDWGLIALSSLVGTFAVTTELTAFFGWNKMFEVMCLATLFFLGLLVQGALLTKNSEPIKIRQS